MPTISIIVPVYKVEKYLHKCINSILTQTFKDFELILVNDGSPDNCGTICDEYSQKDHRVVVIHKKNGGLSDARNAGLDIARGKYIGFVDSDDYIEKDMYELLYTNIIEVDADISICGIFHCYGNKIKKTTTTIKRVCDQIESIEEVLSGKNVGVHACSKLYKKFLFDNARYPVGHIIEDAFIVLDLLSQVKKVVIDSTPKYYYFHRENSITMSAFSEKDYDLLDSYNKNLTIIKNNHEYTGLLEVAEYRYWWAYFTLLNRLAADHKINRKNYTELKNEIKKMIAKNYFSIIKNKYQSIGKIIAFTFIVFSVDLYIRTYHFWFHKIRQ
ncbi:glycosyltransferase family 2 protein [Anaerospora hongkongensis]|uniref:glycosyltransferase family 2 protein n=1 Tax=Anaerospora hongkongensis TaxID=244830 RepID=UPI0028985A39|nr:glycosyltransferase [Anaerospora hongkongensis]